MINLIPKKEKTEMKRAFYVRLVVLFLAMLGASSLIAFFTILPSYFLSSTKINLINAKLELQKSEPVPLPDQQTLATIKNLNNKLSVIEKAQTNKFLVSQKVMNAIILKKLPAIRITEIAYESNTSQQPKKVSIKGNAPSREVLLSFRQALEDSGSCKKVDLPISNFIKGSDIQFYLNVAP